MIVRLAVWMLGCCALVLSVPFELSASPRVQAKDAVEIQIAALKERFLKLRNTDPAALRAGEWHEVVQDLRAVAKSHPERSSSAAALFDAAIGLELLGVREQRDELFVESDATLSEIITRYPRHPLADDALVRRGQLRWERLNQADDAEADFLLVLSKFPRADTAPLAKRYLAALREGKPVVRSFSTVPGATKGVRRSGPLIVIDPGHGGEDFGAVGVGGLLEKDVTLAVSLALERRLVEKGKTVRLTRTTDIFVPLAERTAIANDFEADLFVSLHTNASPEGKLSGLETYFLDTTGDEASRKLAERENAAYSPEGSTHGDLQFMLSDLIQTAKLDDSIRLATTIHSGILKRISSSWGAMHSFGVRKGPFYVLVGAHMPCVLVEMFFIDHEGDGARLADPTFREHLADGIARGIEEYLAKTRARR